MTFERISHYKSFEMVLLEMYQPIQGFCKMSLLSILSPVHPVHPVKPVKPVHPVHRVPCPSCASLLLPFASLSGVRPLLASLWASATPRFFWCSLFWLACHCPSPGFQRQSFLPSTSQPLGSQSEGPCQAPGGPPEE